MGLFSKELKNKFEIAVINEPSVFEPLKVIIIFSFFFQKRVRVVLSCRPEVLDKHKPAKKNANIEAFGFILSNMIHHCYSEKKLQQDGSKTK